MIICGQNTDRNYISADINRDTTKNWARHCKSDIARNKYVSYCSNIDNLKNDSVCSVLYPIESGEIILDEKTKNVYKNACAKSNDPLCDCINDNQSLELARKEQLAKIREVIQTLNKESVDTVNYIDDEYFAKVWEEARQNQLAQMKVIEKQIEDAVEANPRCFLPECIRAIKPIFEKPTCNIQIKNDICIQNAYNDIKATESVIGSNKTTQSCSLGKDVTSDNKGIPSKAYDIESIFKIAENDLKTRIDFKKRDMNLSVIRMQNILRNMKDDYDKKIIDINNKITDTRSTIKTNNLALNIKYNDKNGTEIETYRNNIKTILTPLIFLINNDINKNSTIYTKSLLPLDAAISTNKKDKETEINKLNNIDGSVGISGSLIAKEKEINKAIESFYDKYKSAINNQIQGIINNYQVTYTKVKSELTSLDRSIRDRTNQVNREYKSYADDINRSLKQVNISDANILNTLIKRRLTLDTEINNINSYINNNDLIIESSINQMNQIIDEAKITGQKGFDKYMKLINLKIRKQNIINNEILYRDRENQYKFNIIDNLSNINKLVSNSINIIDQNIKSKKIEIDQLNPKIINNRLYDNKNSISTILLLIPNLIATAINNIQIGINNNQNNILTYDSALNMNMKTDEQFIQSIRDRAKDIMSVISRIKGYTKSEENLFNKLILKTKIAYNKLYELLYEIDSLGIKYDVLLNVEKNYNDITDNKINIDSTIKTNIKKLLTNTYNKLTDVIKQYQAEKESFINQRNIAVNSLNLSFDKINERVKEASQYIKGLKPLSIAGKNNKYAGASNDLLPDVEKELNNYLNIIPSLPKYSFISKSIYGIDLNCTKSCDICKDPNFAEFETCKKISKTESTKLPGLGKELPDECKYLRNLKENPKCQNIKNNDEYNPNPWKNVCKTFPESASNDLKEYWNQNCIKTSEQNNISDDTGKTSYTWIIYVVIAVIILAIILVVGYFMIRKRGINVDKSLRYNNVDNINIY